MTVTAFWSGVVIGAVFGYILWVVLDKQADEHLERSYNNPADGASPGVAMDDTLMLAGAEGFDGRERRLAIEVDRDLGIEPTYQDYARTRTRKATELEAAVSAGRAQA